jgi:hypothetical protein
LSTSTAVPALDPALSAATADQHAKAIPATNTGHGNQPGISPEIRAGALAAKLATTMAPPQMAAAE